MYKVWLITGSANGLGRNIAEAALAAGDSVVAGARRTAELTPLVEQYGERVKSVTLEVRDEPRQRPPCSQRWTPSGGDFLQHGARGRRSQWLDGT
jgi:NADP-dependent 3-hydroxy acid dehydrogenase YdfG